MDSVYESRRIQLLEAIRFVRWHPWAQVQWWLEKWELYNDLKPWSVKEARQWFDYMVDFYWDLIEEVNAHPMHEGLIYPDGSYWAYYILEDIIRWGWVEPEKDRVDSERDTGKYRVRFVMPLTCPCEWLAGQLGGKVGAAMIERKFFLEESGPQWVHDLIKGRVHASWDIGYTKRWEQITGKRLCGEKFKTDAMEWLPARVRYLAR